MREEARRFHVLTQAPEILIAPSRSKACKNAGRRSDMWRIPADTEAIAVQRFLSLSGLEALEDQGILRAVKQIR